MHPLLLALAGCAGDAKETPRINGFPEDFRWGAAIAGFQVDPGCPTLPAEECEDSHSDWYQWVTDEELIAEEGTYLSGDPLSLGPGHWELYAEDFSRAADELHLRSLRTSIEWSRLFPDAPPDEVASVDELAQYADTEAVAAYHAYFSALTEAGLEPLVTLNHYTLPLWLHDGKACHQDPETCTARGWLDADRIVRHIALYAGFCAREFGADIRWWATLNEPWAVIASGYLLPSPDRTNPPGISDLDLAVGVMFAMIEAHAAMVDAVHAEDADAEVGIVANLVLVAPNDPERPQDLDAAEHFDWIYNRLMLEGMVHGELDTNLDGEPDQSRTDLAGRMDYIGLNYYTRVTVSGLGTPISDDYPWTDFLPVVLWEEVPEGIAETAALAASYGVPVIITENGTQDMEDATDRFLLPTLRALEGAIEDGVDVRGYHFWSLIDNYEWNHGMQMDFGLYAVDETTKARTLRQVGADYAAIAEANALPEGG